jgi:hypothetical protein
MGFSLQCNVPNHQEMQFCTCRRDEKRWPPHTACTSRKGLQKQWNKALTDVEALEKELSVMDG